MYKSRIELGSKLVPLCMLCSFSQINCKETDEQFPKNAFCLVINYYHVANSTKDLNKCLGNCKTHYYNGLLNVASRLINIE